MALFFVGFFGVIAIVLFGIFSLLVIRDLSAPEHNLAWISNAL